MQPCPPRKVDIIFDFPSTTIKLKSLDWGTCSRLCPPPGPAIDPRIGLNRDPPRPAVLFLPYQSVCLSGQVSLHRQERLTECSPFSRVILSRYFMSLPKCVERFGCLCLAERGIFTHRFVERLCSCNQRLPTICCLSVVYCSLFTEKNPTSKSLLRCWYHATVH